MIRTIRSLSSLTSKLRRQSTHMLLRNSSFSQLHSRQSHVSICRIRCPAQFAVRTAVTIGTSSLRCSSQLRIESSPGPPFCLLPLLLPPTPPFTPLPLRFLLPFALPFAPLFCVSFFLHREHRNKNSHSNVGETPPQQHRSRHTVHKPPLRKHFVHKGSGPIPRLQRCAGSRGTPQKRGQRHNPR